MMMATKTTTTIHPSQQSAFRAPVRRASKVTVVMRDLRDADHDDMIAPKAFDKITMARSGTEGTTSTESLSLYSSSYSCNNDDDNDHEEDEHTYVSIQEAKLNLGRGLRRSATQGNQMMQADDEDAGTINTLNPKDQPFIARMFFSCSGGRPPVYGARSGKASKQQEECDDVTVATAVMETISKGLDNVTGSAKSWLPNLSTRNSSTTSSSSSSSSRKQRKPRSMPSSREAPNKASMRTRTATPKPTIALNRVRSPICKDDGQDFCEFNVNRSSSSSSRLLRREARKKNHRRMLT